MGNPRQQQAGQRREPDQPGQQREQWESRGGDIQDDEVQRGPEAGVDVDEGVHWFGR